MKRQECTSVMVSVKAVRLVTLLACTMSLSFLWTRMFSFESSDRWGFYAVRSTLNLEKNPPLKFTSEIQPDQVISLIKRDLLQAPALNSQPPQCNNTHQNECEVVHVAILSWGTAVTRDAALLIKSILLYRRDPLHFHIVADKIATVILKELLRSWQPVGVNATFYKLEDVQVDVALKELAPSTVQYFAQLMLPDILPQSVRQVLVFNSNRMLAADVRELWSILSNFHATEGIGAVTSAGGNILTGVMPMHLANLRAMGWSQLWMNERKLIFSSASSVGVFEERIALSLVEHFPSIFHDLPCAWNYLLTDTDESCPILAHQVKAIEFLSERVPTHFWKAFFKVVHYDGNLLRRPLSYACYKSDEDKELEYEENSQQLKLVDTYGDAVCKDYVRELIGTFRTHLFYVDYNYTVTDALDVTLVTQLSMSRINALEKLCSQWKGPVSVAVYLSDKDAIHFLSYVLNSKVFSARKNIAFHVLYEDGSLYPTNHLRNTALGQVQTSHVFVIDVDFVPDSLIYDHIKENLKLSSFTAGKTVLLVPGFETDDYAVSFPDTKEKVLPHLDTGVVYPFRNKTFSRGHIATNYTKWRTATEPYKVIWEEGFEPYFVMRTSEMPRYRENFMGYGMNKIIHIMEVTARGYSFFVMPNSYIIHLPHAETFERIRHDFSRAIKRCMVMLEEDVARELLGKYGEESLNGWKPKLPIQPPLAVAAKQPAATSFQQQPPPKTR